MNKLNSKITSVIIAFLFAFNISIGQANINKLKLDSLMDVLSSKNRFMGCLTVRKNGNILYNSACGISNIDNNINKPSTTETKYRIGSISKMFTSVMIFQLIEENKLSMETKLSGFFPEIPNAKEISISNLLNHRSGIYSITDDTAYLTWNTKPQSQSEILKRICSGKPVFTPNKKGEYSNSNYLLLGYIIEKITGRDYALNLKERITEKIGLKNTYYGGAATAGKNESLSFNYDNDHWVPEAETDMSVPGGAGAIVSTTNDLTAFITALFSGRLISIHSLNNMKTIEAGYGKGIFQKTFYDKTAFGHGGAIDKFYSDLYYIPSDSISIALCCNVNYGTTRIVKAALAIYYNKPYEIPKFNYVKMSKDTLRKYEGTYKHWILPIKTVIKLNGENLTFCILPKNEGVASGAPVYFCDAVTTNKFEMYSNGGSFIINNRKLTFLQENMIPHKIKFKRKKK